MNNDFSLAVIYKISCLDPYIPVCYIGSTKNFINRIRFHKCSYNKDCYLYEFVEENGGWDNFTFSIVEDASYVKNRIELLWRERYYYDLYSPMLNTLCPINSPEEKAEKRKVWDCRYYQKNKEKILEKLSNTFITCECGAKFTKNNQYRHKDTIKHKKYLIAKAELENIIKENKIKTLH